MRSAPIFAKTFWHSGGNVMERWGDKAISLDPFGAKQALDFLSNTAGRCLAKGDVDGAAFCRDRLEQLGAACREAAAWTRCAGVAA